MSETIEITVTETWEFERTPDNHCSISRGDDWFGNYCAKDVDEPRPERIPVRVWERARELYRKWQPVTATARTMSMEGYSGSSGLHSYVTTTLIFENLSPSEYGNLLNAIQGKDRFKVTIEEVES